LTYTLTTTAAPWSRARRINATCPACSAPIVGTSATRRPDRFKTIDVACISRTVRMISMLAGKIAPAAGCVTDKISS
jgi:hypothetical protein